MAEKPEKLNGMSMHSRHLWTSILVSLVTVAAAVAGVRDQPPVSGQAGRAEESVELLTRYLRLDTTNPPGGEIRAAQFFGEIFEREGIEYRILESAPGRGNIWARLRGNGSGRPVILLNHLDVVPHDARYWSVPPFGGEVRDGFIFGRGALDMKSLAIAQLMLMLKLRRERIPLARDLIFIGTADEEAGGRLGAGWLVATHPELLGSAEYLLTEGGGNIVEEDGRVLSIGLSPVEKAPAWLQLTSVGPAGHASIPRSDSAVNHLLRALNRLLNWTPPLKVTPVVEQYFRSLVPLLPAPEAKRYAALHRSITDPEFRARLDSDPAARALFQNTIAITGLEGSSKVNVISPQALALLDTRLLPGERLDQWIRDLARVIDDERITITPLLAFEPIASPVDTPLTKILAEVAARHHPGALITYPVTAGFTDSHYFRREGIRSYGFSPFVAPPGLLGDGHHGNDERIGRQAFVRGVQFLREVLEPLVRRP